MPGTAEVEVVVADTDPGLDPAPWEDVGVVLIDARGGLHLDTLVSSGSVPVYDGDGLANVRVAARNREWGNDTPLEFLVQIWPAEVSPIPESDGPAPPAPPSPMSVSYDFAHLHVFDPHRANPYDADTGDFLHVTPSGLLRISDGRPPLGGGRTANVYIDVFEDGDPGTVPDVEDGQPWQVTGEVVIPASWGLVLAGGLDGLDVTVYQGFGVMAHVRVFARSLRQEYERPVFSIQIWQADGHPEQLFPPSALPEPRFLP